MSNRSGFSRYLSCILLSTALVGGFLVAASPAQAYQPGTAAAVSLVRDPYTGAWKYTCKYSGWRSDAKVVYHCALYGFTAEGGYRLLEDNKGSWTPPPSSKTRTFSEMVAIGSGNICVRARAYSVDGGHDSRYRLCRFSW